jgi:hypothetical protein
MEPWEAGERSYARAQHVWVDLTNTWGDRAAPGILVDWRRGRRGWEALVIHASTHSTGSGAGFTVTQSWVPGHLIRTAEVMPAPPRDNSKARPANHGRSG